MIGLGCDTIQVINEGVTSVAEISRWEGGKGVEKQGIQVQDEQQGGQGAASTDTTKLGVTKGGPP